MLRYLRFVRKIYAFFHLRPCVWVIDKEIAFFERHTIIRRTYPVVCGVLTVLQVNALKRAR